MIAGVPSLVYMVFFGQAPRYNHSKNHVMIHSSARSNGSSRGTSSDRRVRRGGVNQKQDREWERQIACARLLRFSRNVLYEEPFGANDTQRVTSEKTI